MSAEQQLRHFLFWLAGAICLGTIVELLLTEHYKEPTQLIPLVLCGLGTLAVGAALFRPGRSTFSVLRLVMGVLIAGSLFGVYEHVAGNLAFELEIRPGAAFADVWLAALKGAAPLLAPGILALAGMLAIAATYRHPLLTMAGPPRR